MTPTPLQRALNTTFVFFERLSSLENGTPDDLELITPDQQKAITECLSVLRSQGVDINDVVETCEVLELAAGAFCDYDECDYSEPDPHEEVLRRLREGLSG